MGQKVLEYPQWFVGRGATDKNPVDGGLGREPAVSFDTSLGEQSDPWWPQNHRRGPRDDVSQRLAC